MAVIDTDRNMVVGEPIKVGHQPIGIAVTRVGRPGADRRTPAFSNSTLIRRSSSYRGRSAVEDAGFR
jgi:hypothetical protein